MKPNYGVKLMKTMKPAAFGRLCVETPVITDNGVKQIPAAFGRLCVETFKI